jgi:hypothetical protein
MCQPMLHRDHPVSHGGDGGGGGDGGAGVLASPSRARQRNRTVARHVIARWRVTVAIGLTRRPSLHWNPLPRRWLRHAEDRTRADK